MFFLSAFLEKPRLGPWSEKGFGAAAYGKGLDLIPCTLSRKATISPNPWPVTERGTGVYPQQTLQCCTKPYSLCNSAPHQTAQKTSILTCRSGPPLHASSVPAVLGTGSWTRWRKHSWRQSTTVCACVCVAWERAFFMSYRVRALVLFSFAFLREGGAISGAWVFWGWFPKTTNPRTPRSSQNP